MNQDNASLIFIPDITGFTQFVNQTEIKHGQHIISELLEILIDSNQLGMEVAEIEGDAVLFYLESKVPAVPELLDQAKQMFLNFHNHLQEYEARRICRCGACSTAHELSLKFIVHQGEIGFTTVRNRTKPYGAEIVKSHKLMKNSINSPEYILFSEPFSPGLEAVDFEGLTFSEGNEDYKDVGTVNYSFTKLTSFRDLISPVQPTPPPPKVPSPLTKKIHIDRPTDEVYSLLMDLDLRLLWNEGLDNLEYERNRVNRVGTRHTCLFPVGQAEFQTTAPDRGTDTRVYGEEMLNPPFARQLFLYYLLSPSRGQTELSVELHYFPKPVTGWIMAPLIKFKFAKQLNVTLNSLKTLSEANANEPEVTV